MTLQGYQFDKAKVTPEADAQLYSYLAQSSDNKVISGLTATTTGLNVYVAAGKALVQGRLIENGQQMQLTAQANKTGYVCITIDLTQDNTSTGTPGTSNYAPVNNQLRLELVDTLNQQNLNSGGLIYTFPLYSYVSTGATLTLAKVLKNYKMLDSNYTGLVVNENVNLGAGKLDCAIKNNVLHFSLYGFAVKNSVNSGSDQTLATLPYGITFPVQKIIGAAYRGSSYLGLVRVSNRSLILRPYVNLTAATGTMDFVVHPVPLFDDNIV
ncbi:hypothetical protein [Pseudolactococcus raffinolactis]|uniref:hypothetical protein n=1 Tax=Pseudolactococcus raffinolactis TaxID=1366 RepID=UPI0028A04980|nr:hypothetical protein [Lactococcus raffinolactis]